MDKQFAENLGIMNKTALSNLQNQTVLLIGLGGLGGFFAQSLARLGIKKVILIDPDHFTLSNLNRQCFSHQENLGAYKVDVVAEALQKIYPQLEIISYKNRIQALDNTLFHAVNIIVDATDDITTKLFLETLSTTLKIPLLHGAVGGWFGQYGLIEPNQTVLKQLYGSMKKGLEKTQGSPTFTPPIIANLMIATWVAYWLKKPSFKANVIWLFDALSSSIDSFDIVLSDKERK